MTTTFNPPERLPPVDCPLLIQSPAGTVRAERTSHLQDKAGQMEYRLDDGSIITGRYAWTYP